MASALIDARRRRRGVLPAGQHPLVALAAGKPPDFSGYPGGRPVDISGEAPAPALHLAGANPLVAAMQQGPDQAFSDIGALSRRTHDPLAQYRRQQRLAMGIHLGPGRTDEDVQRARAAHLLAGGKAGEGQVQFTGTGGDDTRSAGSKLANIRWHGHPDGPQNLDASMAQVNALRRAAARFRG